jgi:hypothetical protein
MLGRSGGRRQLGRKNHCSVPVLLHDSILIFGVACFNSTVLSLDVDKIWYNAIIVAFSSRMSRPVNPQLLEISLTRYVVECYRRRLIVRTLRLMRISKKGFFAVLAFLSLPESSTVRSKGVKALMSHVNIFAQTSLHNYNSEERPRLLFYGFCIKG